MLHTQKEEPTEDEERRTRSSPFDQSSLVAFGVEIESLTLGAEVIELEGVEIHF